MTTSHFSSRFGVILCLIVALVAAAAYAEPGERFPSIKTANLAKTKMQLPDDFAAERNVILASFGRDMQDAVDAWDAALAPLRDGVKVQVYNTPLIPNPGAIVRGFISGGMRSIYKDPEVRDRVIVLYVDEDEFFPALGVTARDAPLVLVIDRAGVEIGRVQGTLDDANLAAVRDLIER